MKKNTARCALNSIVRTSAKASKKSTHAHIRRKFPEMLFIVTVVTSSMGSAAMQYSYMNIMKGKNDD